MSLPHVVAAGAVAGVVSVLTSWAITGGLFHRYQRLTPDTWRQEGPSSYALSSALNIVECIGIGLLFALSTGFPAGRSLGWAPRGLLFGMLCWGALVLPPTLIQSIYVRLHRGVVIGTLVDSLVLCILAAMAASWSVA